MFKVFVAMETPGVFVAMETPGVKDLFKWPKTLLYCGHETIVTKCLFLNITNSLY